MDYLDELEDGAHFVQADSACNKKFIKLPVEKCAGIIREPGCRLSFIFRQLMVAKKNFQNDGK